jgi:hypothetical protein
MKARDVFGIIVRTGGFCTVLYAIWNVVFGIVASSGIINMASVPGLPGAYFVFGIPALIVGLLLMRFGRQIVRFSYPENKDDTDS